MVALKDFFEVAKAAFKASKNFGHFLGVTIGDDKVRFLSVNVSRKIIISLWRNVPETWGRTTLQEFYSLAEKAFRNRGLPGILKGITLEGKNVYFVSVVSSNLEKTIWKEAAVEWYRVCQSLEEIGRYSCLTE